MNSREDWEEGPADGGGGVEDSGVLIFVEEVERRKRTDGTMGARLGEEPEEGWDLVEDGEEGEDWARV